MRRVERSEVLDYATYAEEREARRAAILPVKRARRVHLGEHLTFLFENHDTVLYQIQEMLLAEKIVKEAEIRHELETYNELLGEDGGLGAVLLIEIDDPAERQVKLVSWRDLPRHLYVALEGGRRVPATYDERQVGEERVSSVQYLRFATGGAVPVAVGAAHPELTLEAPLSEEQRRALAEDLA